MRRRDLLLLSTPAVLVFIGRPEFSQAADQVYRVGVLAPEGMRAIEIFRERLAQLGWIEGRNIRFDYRSTGGDDTRQSALAAELVTLRVDLILTWGTPATLAAKQATSTIPIVMGSIGDPVTVGVVSNLAHPGGNVTGFVSQAFLIEEKRFELLHELVPGMTRVVMLGNIGNLYADLAGCGKSRDFGETVMKRARNGNPGLIKSTGYEGAKGDESGWKHHRPTFSAAC